MFAFLLETFILGLKNLHLHKLRSLLTALGIILGVAAVIVMVAIGEGGKKTAIEQMEQLGATNVLVRSVKPAESNDASQKMQRVLDYGIKRLDYQRISQLPRLTNVVPMRDVEQRVVHGELRASAQAYGTTPDAFQVMNLAVERGRVFTQVDYNTQSAVCVLGSMAAQQLFPYSDPLGETIQVGSSGTATVVLTVVGVLAPTGLRADSAAGSMVGRNIDQDIYFPLTLAQETFGDAIIKRQAGAMERKQIELSEIWLRVDEVKNVEETAGLVENIIKSARPGGPMDVQVSAPIQILRNAEQLGKVFNFVIVTIAAVSLLVGGIGIMNIMLATVTERTKEIGIRRALGAKKRHITLQFLIETTVISLSGGLLGVGLGVGSANLLPKAMAFFGSATVYRTSIAMWSVVGGLSISVMIGIAFGLYPAMKAAAMNPIEALRHE